MFKAVPLSVWNTGTREALNLLSMDKRSIRQKVIKGLPAQKHRGE